MAPRLAFHRVACIWLLCQLSIALTSAALCFDESA
jgi:hypothetical protein